METKLSAALSAEDAALLEAFLDPEFTLLDLARRFNTPLLHLIDRLQSAPMQAAIAAYRALTDLAAALVSSKARLAGLAVLREIVETSDNPIERRRAATTLVRATTPPRHPRAPARSPAAAESPAEADAPAETPAETGAPPAPEPAPHPAGPPGLPAPPEPGADSPRHPVTHTSVERDRPAPGRRPRNDRHANDRHAGASPPPRAPVSPAHAPPAAA